jgi:MraZ protein
MLRGGETAKIDEKSRLRIPAKFRRNMPETVDNMYFITSVDGECAQVYPIPVWERIEQKLMEAPRMHPAKVKLRQFTSYYGTESEMDLQGRVLIPAEIREDAKLSGDVVVIGHGDYLEIWNKQVINGSMKEHPVTSEDREKWADFGI